MRDLGPGFIPLNHSFHLSFNHFDTSSQGFLHNSIVVDLIVASASRYAQVASKDFTQQDDAIFSCIFVATRSKYTWDALQEEYQETTKKFSEAAKVREKWLPHEHELYICFADIAAMGEYAWTPTSRVLPLFMQSDEDREQSWEDIADSSPIYTTLNVDVTGGGAVGVGVGGGIGRGGGGEGGVGSRGRVGGDPSTRQPSDGGFVIRKKKKNEVDGEQACIGH